jgi:hypothetical protein
MKNKVVTLLLGCLLACNVLAADKQLRIGTLAPKNSLYHRQLMELGEVWRGAGRQWQVSGLSGWQPGRRSRHGAPDAHRPVAGRPAVGRRPARDRTVDCRPAKHAADVPQLGRSRLRARKNARRRWKRSFSTRASSSWPGATPAGSRFFRKHPAVRPDDFKKMKFFTWVGETDQQEIMKSLGYIPVPLETNDILPAQSRPA